MFGNIKWILSGLRLTEYEEVSFLSSLSFEIGSLVWPIKLQLWLQLGQLDVVTVAPHLNNINLLTIDQQRHESTSISNYGFVNLD